MTRLAWSLIGGFLSACLLLAAGAWAGHKVTQQAWDISKLQDKNAALAFAGKMNVLGAQLTGQLTTLRAKNHDLLAHQKSEAPNATAVYKPTLDAAPVVLPDYRFTRYAVCLWNSAGLSSGANPGAASVDGAVACADAPDALLLSDVTPGDALSNELDNAASCRDDRDTLSKAQAFLAALANGS